MGVSLVCCAVTGVPVLCRITLPRFTPVRSRDLPLDPTTAGAALAGRQLTGVGFGGRLARCHGPAVAPWLRDQPDDLVPG